MSDKTKPFIRLSKSISCINKRSLVFYEDDDDDKVLNEVVNFSLNHTFIIPVAHIYF